VVIKALKRGEWNKMKWSGKIPLFGYFMTETEHYFHSIVWIVDGMK
jgi:hypothetical protein